MLSIALIVTASYLLGSLSPGLLVSRLQAGIDVRDHGSGSSGGTNVVRILGWRPGLIVVASDLAKGFLAAWLVSRVRIDSVPWSPSTVEVLAGLGAVVGHVWPAWTGLRGGKGVATSGGALLAVAPVSFVACAVVFASLCWMVGFVSVASLGTAWFLVALLVAAKLAGWWPVPGTVLGYAVAVAALILWVHRSNITRLRAGTEPALGDRHPRGDSGFS